MALRITFVTMLRPGIPCCKPLVCATRPIPRRTMYTRTPSLLKVSIQDKIATQRGIVFQSYRCPPPDDPIVETIADILMTFVWCYIFWRFYHDGHTLINYGVDYIDYSTYSDAELGIEEEIED